MIPHRAWPRNPGADVRPGLVVHGGAIPADKFLPSRD